MENKDKLTLLKLARESIQSKFEGKDLEINIQEISDALKQKRGTFVTLKINGRLRGCIGHIAPVQELYRDVIENA
ncbi:MAG: AMMECR1 domain-containing protein, partial [Candidatus Moraniibacteriota bacterium]